MRRNFKGTNVVDITLGSNNLERSQHLRIHSPVSLTFPFLSLSHLTPRNAHKTTSTCLILPPRFSSEPPRNEMNLPTAFLERNKMESETAAVNPNNCESMISSSKAITDVAIASDEDIDYEGGDSIFLFCEPPNKDFFKSVNKKEKHSTFTIPTLWSSYKSQPPLREYRMRHK
mmetsp:Transcript_18088/g.26856  ORF Transcript_18088/g.26856 Transcript_18088/m.26856 type:complete len:173 (+) Transcript_18088:164-682(+)